MKKGFLKWTRDNSVEFQENPEGNIFLYERPKPSMTKLEYVEALHKAKNEYLNKVSEITREYRDSEFTELLRDLQLI